MATYTNLFKTHTNLSNSLWKPILRLHKPTWDLRCVSVIRKAQISPRVWTFLRFNGENQWKTKKNKGIQGLSFLYNIFYFFSCYTTPPYEYLPRFWWSWSVWEGPGVSWEAFPPIILHPDLMVPNYDSQGSTSYSTNGLQPGCSPSIWLFRKTRGLFWGKSGPLTKNVCIQGWRL